MSIEGNIDPAKFSEFTSGADDKIEGDQQQIPSSAQTVSVLGSKTLNPSPKSDSHNTIGSDHNFTLQQGTSSLSKKVANVASNVASYISFAKEIFDTINDYLASLEKQNDKTETLKIWANTESENPENLKLNDAGDYYELSWTEGDQEYSKKINDDKYAALYEIAKAKKRIT